MMLKLSIFWSYVKKYWQLIVAIILFVVGFFFFKTKYDDLADILEENRKRHEQELDDIKKAYEQELKDREEALRKMQETMAQIEKMYEEAQKELDEKKRKEIQQIIEETQDDPEELARRLSESTGFDVVIPQ